jgi:hypothetical protein
VAVSFCWDGSCRVHQLGVQLLNVKTACLFELREGGHSLAGGKQVRVLLPSVCCCWWGCVDCHCVQ